MSEKVSDIGLVVFEEMYYLKKTNKNFLRILILIQEK